MSEPTTIPAGELTAKHIGRRIGFTYPIRGHGVQGTFRGMEAWPAGMCLFLSEHEREWNVTLDTPVTILPEDGGT